MSSSSSFLLRLFFDVLFFGLLFFVGFSCSCNAGFKEVEDVEVHDPKHQCEDINECLDGDYEHGCDANAACTNHVGSANTCECNEGFFGDGAACQSWTMCGANEHETVAPTATSDGQCACDAHYESDGVACHNIDDCLSEPCQNGGTCQDGLGTHTCECAAGYTGDNCETDIDDCAHSPCENDGDCHDGINGHTCTCAEGYTGLNCEIDVDECSAEIHTCGEDATCTNNHGSFDCECNEGFFGDGAACQSWTMCGANGHETVAPTTASDGQCACDAHYDGDGVVCHNINDCASEPCQNGGTCQDGLGTHSCTCVGGFTGDDCETCSPANAQPTVSGSATNIRVHWQGEVSAWNDRPYRASDLGVFTQSNFEYEVQTSVNHRRDGYVVTPAFDATVVIVSENRWDLTAPRFAHLEECPEAWKVTSAGSRAHAPNQSGQSGFIKYNLYGHRSVSAWTFAMNYCYKSNVSAGTPVSVPAAEVNGGRYDVEKTLTFVKSQCGTVTV